VIDISDGLLADLGHILRASNLGAQLDLQACRFSDAAQSCAASTGKHCVLSGGMIMNCVLPLRPARHDEIVRIGADSIYADADGKNLAVTIVLCGCSSVPINVEVTGYAHF